MLQRVRKRMDEEGIEVLCVNEKYNMQYIFGKEISGYAFITRVKVEMVLPRSYLYVDLGDYNVEYCYHREDYEEIFESMEYGQVHIDDESRLEEYFETEVTDLISEMRKEKTAEEVEKLRKAAEITEGAIRSVRDDLVGSTELEIFQQLQKYYSDRGVFESFVRNEAQSLVQSNSMTAHRKPGDREIKSEDLVIVDTGALYKGYCADVSRTYCGNPSEKQQELHDAVREIQQELIEMIEPGLKIAEWKQREIDLVREKGFDPEKNLLYFSHNIGIEVHESPSLSKSTDEEFREGMVFTVEPGLHVEDLGGVRIEDMVYLGEDGTEILSDFSRRINPT